MKRVALIAVLLHSACAPLPDRIPPLPPSASAGPRSAAANVISGAAAAFANPAVLAGRPAEAAIAVERLEWLAEAVSRDLQFSNFSSMAGPSLMAARSEVRAALGITPDAPPSLVIARLDEASAALMHGDVGSAEAALATPTFAPGTLARLASLPRLPQANNATRLVQRDLEFGRQEPESE